jgi:hypothetical protein
MARRHHLRRKLSKPLASITSLKCAIGRDNPNDGVCALRDRPYKFNGNINRREWARRGDQGGRECVTRFFVAMTRCDGGRFGPNCGGGSLLRVMNLE